MLPPGLITLTHDDDDDDDGDDEDGDDGDDDDASVLIAWNHCGRVSQV